MLRPMISFAVGFLGGHSDTAAGALRLSIERGISDGLPLGAA